MSASRRTCSPRDQPARRRAQAADRPELLLRDALFDDDAIIFAAPRSRSLVYGAPGAPALAIAWEALPTLGVWAKPGAPFVCIEPWQGHSDAAGYTGDFRNKPSVIEVSPGATRTFGMRVELLDSFPSPTRSG